MGVFMVVAVVVVAVIVLSNQEKDARSETDLIPTRISGLATSTPFPSATDTEVPSPVPQVVVTDTASPAPTDTLVPATNTPVPTFTPVPPTATLVPTFTPIPPTATLVPPTMTPIPTSGDAAPPPTVLYPNGRPVQLYYDPYSFYMWNGGSDSFRVSSIDFEALDSSGTPLGYRFEGYRWSQFWHSVESGKCDALEIGNAPGLLKPAQCRGYNAVINPELTDPMVFWIARDGVPQFRVLWEGQEIGRCEIAAGFCAVWLPG